ncbi:hypothetical protein KHQ82_06905 [Mycoplasmatota bacterium]|nr:hypothetical protein KHQ82_06905 [Mycoplasmatota bacterium]
MKKLFSLLAALALVLTLAACNQDPEEIIKEVIKEVEIEVPGETVYVEVPGPEVTKYVDVPGPEIEVEVYIDVPTEVENTRFYKPGVYFNNTDLGTDGFYTYTVVIVDAYGKIAGVMFDETKTTSEFLIGGDQLYVYVEGDGKTVPNTYRAIASNADFNEYPTAADAITADDLVVGIHETAIAELTEIVAHESRQILGEAWVGETELLAERIIADQTTYGVETAESGAVITAVNVEGVKLTNVDVLLGLVQDVLDGEAKLEESEVLATTPVHGLYEAGYEFGVTGRLVGDNVSYNTAFVAVDQYGRIAGVYTDATMAADLEGGHATNWITGANEWDNQAKALGEAIVKNQGVAFNLYDSTDYDVVIDGDSVHHYTNQVEGCTVAVEDMLTAINDSLGELDDWGTFNNGTYVVTGEVSHGGHAIMTVDIVGNAVKSIFLDNTSAVEQATVLRDDEWFPVYKFDREWLDAANEEQSETILVYLDVDEYIAVNEYTADGKTIDAGDEVTLTETELAGVEIVPGNYTKQILKERYGMNEENSWYTQANTLATAFVAAGNPYEVNLTDGTHTDLTGVTIGHVEEYQQLFVEALLLALEDDSDAPAELVEFTTIGDPDAELADGTYFASLEANSKGQQYMAYMVVDGGDIQSIVFDATLVKDEVVTTKLSLGEAYGMATEEDQLEWNMQAAAYAASVVEDQAAVVDTIEASFTYELDDEVLAGDWASVDTPAGVSIDVLNFQSLTEALVKQALVAQIEVEADAIFTQIAGEDTLFYSEMAVKPFTFNSTALTFGDDSQALFEIDFESSDNDVLDVDELAGPPATYQFVTEDVTANTDITITYTLTFDEYEFTEDITYTVQTAASAELAALNAEEDNFDAFTQIEGFNFDLTTINPTVATTDGTFLGWADENYDAEAPVYLTTTSGLAVGTHTLTALVSYNADDDTVSRDLVVTVLDVDAALEEVAATVKPANILHNGEVTSEAVFTFGNTTDVKGINITWNEDVDNDTDVADFDGTNELTILRSYETEKIIMAATISDGVTDIVKEFEFRAVSATPAIVKARVEDEIPASLGVKYFDTDGAATPIVDLDTILEQVDFEVFEAAADMNITWETDDTNLATVEAGNILTAKADINDKVVTVTLTVEVDMDSDGTYDVEVSEDYEIILFDSVA